MDEHKTLKKVVKGVAIGGAIVSGIALAPIAIGFGSAGIAAGSIAAAIQSGIGNVAAGSAFATMTSLGMTGTFTTAAATGGAAAVGGAAASADGTASFFNRLFGYSPEKDIQKILRIVSDRENPEKLIELIQYRKPIEREIIRFAYDNLGGNHNFDREILNYIPQNQNAHMQNLIRPTDNIVPLTSQIRNYLMNQPFSKHFEREFSYVIDARLINNVILFNDNPLIIIRLIEYRSDEQRVKIDKEFRKVREDPERRMLLYIIDYIGNNHPDIPYLFALLEDTI